MTTSPVNVNSVHNDLDATKRHGYAFYMGEHLVGWGFSAKQHKLFGPAVTRAVNVQNGAYFEYENGELVAQVWADGTRVPVSSAA